MMSVFVTILGTIGISIALASMMLNVAFWLVSQAKQPRPVVLTRNREVVGSAVNVMALQKKTKQLSRAA